MAGGEALGRSGPARRFCPHLAEIDIDAAVFDIDIQAPAVHHSGAWFMC